MTNEGGAEPRPYDVIERQPYWSRGGPRGRPLNEELE